MAKFSFMADCVDCVRERKKHPKQHFTQLRRSEVVFDKDLGEYVNFLNESYDCPGAVRALVFNPRCGENYTTTIRPLNKREKGLARD